MNRILISVLFCLSIAGSLSAQSTTFNYQGKLTDTGITGTGPYDFVFMLWDSLINGDPVGSTITLDDVTVTSGIFKVALDFGPVAFSGPSPRYLEIQVRPGASTGSYTLLGPRQPVRSAPFAIRSISAGSADSLSAVANGNYIQNGTSQQTTSNFNISGNGTAGGTLSGNAVNSTTQYNINDIPVLSNAGFANVFAGGGSGRGGDHNSFFGYLAGSTNSTGTGNTLIGARAGEAITTGNSNTFVGAQAGYLTTTAISNVFVGLNAGVLNTTGEVNTFLGAGSGYTNSVGTSNTTIGSTADVLSDNLTFATAIGAAAKVGASNSLVLGRADGPGTNVGIGTTAPNYRLHVVGQDVRVEGNNTGVFPRYSLNFTGGAADAKKWQHYATTNALIFSGINDAENTENRWLQVQRTGANITSLQIPNGNVSIGSFAVTPDKLGVNGTVSLLLGSGGSTSLCQNASFQISTCSSSLRYKMNVAKFADGLSLVRQLRPISFDWKTDGKKDVGFGAEDVATVDPRFVTYNDKGEVEGVKYDRLSVAFVNAFKEQQAQIEAQQKQIETQKTEIDSLKALVCATNQDAEICKKK